MAYEGIKKSGLPDDYLPVVVLTFGKSYGEDQVIGDIKYRNNPQLLRGAVVRGVRLDGDLDMAIKLASDNNIPLNTDGHTYDKKALNFTYSDDFLSCVNEYNQYTKFSLKVVENGKTTSRDTMVTADLVATWTPGDVRVAEGPRAAMSATIVSTKTYSSIMPNITIMSRKFVNDNRDKMVKLTAALATAGDQIKSYTQIRKYACGLNAKIWNEQNAEYWYQYFTPQNRLNMTLGGSMVFNLSDMNNMFGMNGKAYVYKSIYNTFAKLQSKLYPEDFAKNEMFPQGYVPFEQVVDNSILYEANQKYTQLQLSKEFKADYSGSIKNVVSDKEMHILFETGKYDIPNNMYDELNELAEALIATQGLKIKVEGHTDNVGNALSNKELSQKRADAVVQYLINKGIELERITSEGFGDVKPKASNSTSEGRSINRRVEIIQGN
jgi:outer membrane protein OmpA-like peptidoglycan-associated protein